MGSWRVDINIFSLRSLWLVYKKMADSVSVEELMEFKEAFDLLAKEDGRVNVNEFGRLLKSVGINVGDAEMNSIYQELDADKEGSIEFPDFLGVLAKKMKSKDSETELREAFNILDEKRTGFVKSSDLMQMLVNVMGENEKEVKAMLKEVEKNGEINCEDFIHLVLK